MTARMSTSADFRDTLLKARRQSSRWLLTLPCGTVNTKEDASYPTISLRNAVDLQLFQPVDLRHYMQQEKSLRSPLH